MRHHVPEAIRRAALEEEIGLRLHTAAQDMDYARGYAEVAPKIGQPAEAYLDRWIALATGGHVLVGPRYLGLDPDLPFVGVSASDRPLRPSDRESLVAIARRWFAPFNPGFVLLQSADPGGSWPDSGSETRQVVGVLGDLRGDPAPPELSTAPRRDTAFYERYRQIHQKHVAREPVHARHARVEAEADLRSLAEQGLLYDVLIDGDWAGLVAAENDARGGIRRATVVELILADEHRGNGYGKYLSILLAKALPLPDGEFLMGTIHANNIPAYRSALSARRVDIRGEIRIPV